MADSSVKVYNAFLEDDNCNIFFPYVGEKSILGLTHPQYIFKNKDKHKYAMVALYTLIDTGDTGYMQYISDQIMVVGTSTTTKENITMDTIKNVTLDISGFGTSGNIISANIKVTNNLPDNINTEYGSSSTSLSVFGTKETWVSEDNKKYFGLGIWIDATDLMYIMTKSRMSLSTNSCPIDTEHYPSSYSVGFLCNDNAVADKNICNNDNTITDKTICTGVLNTNDITEDLEEIHKIIDGMPYQYPSNTVTYNPTYTPSGADAEDTVPPFGVRVGNEGKFITVDSVNKVFTISKEGIYQLQLKNGFYLIQGETRLDVKVYINDDEIREMSYSTYLRSNQDGKTNPSKAIKNTFSTNVYTTRLKPTDKIKITATWTNDVNLKIENETMMTVTGIQFNFYKRNEWV